VIKQNDQQGILTVAQLKSFESEIIHLKDTDRKISTGVGHSYWLYYLSESLFLDQYHVVIQELESDYVKDSIQYLWLIFIHKNDNNLLKFIKWLRAYASGTIKL
jgi:hypothetical protein